MSNWVDTTGVDQAHPSLSLCARRKRALGLCDGQPAGWLYDGFKKYCDSDIGESAWILSPR